MAYEKITISEALANISKGKMYLPVIQRKYVWEERQITQLMDSIMLDYPIGTFLFWKVEKLAVNENEYLMYEFIKDYDERDHYNNLRAPAPFPDSWPGDFIHAVLDGQQRLTSLYIGLQGSLTKKLPRRRKSSPEAFPIKELYLNLRHLGQGEEDDCTYQFAFLTEKEVSNVDSTDRISPLWFKVKEILKYRTQTEINTKLIIPNGWVEESQVTETLVLLFERLVKDKLINYFEIENTDSIDDVLEIFVRVNSGGTVLSKSDLLYSTIVSHWDGARDEVDRLLVTINRMGEGFSFTNDFIMCTCLYLMKLSTTLTVSMFKKDSVLQMRDDWENIKDAIKSTVELLVEFGFNSENITSTMAIVPIIYYKYHGGVFDSETKPELRRFFIIAQLKGIFRSSTNTALNTIRKELDKRTGKFKLSWLQGSGIRFSGDRTLLFTESDIEDLLDTHEKGNYTFMLLSLLYPHFKYGQKGFHQDHLHPFASFETKRLKGLVFADGSTLTDEKIQEWQHLRNTLPNLQLLEGWDNEKKSNTPLKDWMNVPGNQANAKFIPQGISLELTDFESFYAGRRVLMLDELKKILL